MVTAAIAYEDLAATDPQVLERVAALLEAHPDRGPFEVAEDRSAGRERLLRLMMECARWPDDARGTPFDHPTWHTQLRPIIDAADPPPTSPSTETVMDGLEAFALNARVMANPEAPAADRAVALCWVMHLTGDVHQPLHAAQLFSAAFPSGDRAGSLQHVRDPWSSEIVTLHWFWDDSVHRSGEFHSVLNRASDLSARHPRPSLLGSRTSSGLDYEAWAEESHALARALTYRDGAVGGTTPGTARALEPEYTEAVVAAAERRVATAGYRIADLLREAFSG
jgi:hypothetical protein